MEFSSLYFLYLFLPLTLLVYFLVPGLRLKNIILLAASLLFYAMGQPVYVLLLVGLSYANFAMARRIRPGKRNTLLLPVVVNLAVLGLFKYLDFFLGIFGITVADGGVMLAALRGITNGLNSIGFAFRRAHCPSACRSMPSRLSPMWRMSIAVRSRRSVRSSICCSTSLCSRR